MDRALDRQLLLGALAGRSGLPTADELQTLLGNTEVQLFLRRAELPTEVLDTGWYLHAVASVDEARDRYTAARQRQAFLVSAHIFDLALTESRWTRAERLTLGFAAAIGYRRGGRDPNATAIVNQLRADISTDDPVQPHLDTLALEAGLALLGFQTRTLFSWFSAWRHQLAGIARELGARDLTTTALGTTHLVVLGADDLLRYLARGDRSRLGRAQQRFSAAALGAAGPMETDARWVAAHLLALSGEAAAGSVWNPDLVPPDLPDVVRHAFTLGSPPVLTLWSPQRELLTGTRSPFDPAVRRLVLSVPTSGGKTLAAQMLAVTHLATAPTGVCYVAPTRTLGREVRSAMASRVRILQKEVAPDQPDFPFGAPRAAAEWPFDPFLENSGDGAPDVEVMTPERLAHALRHDANAVLSRFGLFIFDEAQLISEAGRGFVVESVIAYLHYATRTTNHKIILISAAMGNAGTIIEWLAPDGTGQLYESDWRGPRRLHAAICTEPDWNTTTVETTKGRKYPYRLNTQLRGLIRLRLAEGQIVPLRTEPQPDWILSRRAVTNTVPQYDLDLDTGRTTRQYMMASQMITLLGHAGSVLVVAGTRALAEQLAAGLAAQVPEHAPSAPLVDFVRQQLGDDHPLVSVLHHGVGFHHAGLPQEVLEALEEAVRNDALPYLTCTSTLTDGVNLPVRTVVIYDQYYPDQPQEQRLQGARLVNAIGRAGRAGKETEGWIVLVRGAAPSPSDFQDLEPGAERLAITSSLLGDALNDFATLEQELRADHDALFRRATGPTADFISFVWFVLAAEENTAVPPADVDLGRLLESVLATHQSPTDAGVFTAIAEAVRAAYTATDPSHRRRWPRTGTSIGTARLLDQIAAELTAQISAASVGDLAQPGPAMAFLGHTLTRLLDLPENSKTWRFRRTNTDYTAPVDLVAVLTGWLRGSSLPDLATYHLSEVVNPAKRIGQMVDAVTHFFEHYLAWTLGALIELINARLADDDDERRICPELPGYIRYGVDDPRALVLVTAGIRSRRLAHEIAASAPDELLATTHALREWLGAMSITDWRTRYNATGPEVLDLLDFTRVRGRSLLRTLLEAGTVRIELPITIPGSTDANATLRLEPMPGEPDPAPVGLSTGTNVLVTPSASDQGDLSAILDTGLDLSLRIEVDFAATWLVISLRSDDNDEES